MIPYVHGAAVTRLNVVISGKGAVLRRMIDGLSNSLLDRARVEVNVISRQVYNWTHLCLPPFFFSAKNKFLLR